MEERFIGNLLGLSFMKWWFLLIPKVGMTLFVGYLCYMGWITLGPHKPVPDVARMKAADHAVEKIVNDIQQNRGDIRNVALCHFANDVTDYFSRKLRENIEQSNILTLSDMAFSEKLRTMLNLRNRGAASANEALSAVKLERVEGILWGHLDRFESVKGVATLIGEWQLLDARTGDVVCGGQIREGMGSSKLGETISTLATSTAEVEIAVSAIPWYIRFLGFVLLVLLLPIVTISFIRTMVAKRSNKVNVFVLSVYTVIDIILAFLMVGGALTSFAVVLMFLIASLLAFFYNVSLMSFALRLETE